MRPFFPYYGSKYNMARRYAAPTRSVVVEPFAGSAGYSTFYDVPCAMLVDADPIIVGVWDYLIRVSHREVLSLPDILEVGDNVNNYAIPQEARWLIGFWLNRGSAQPKLSRTAYSARNDKSQLTWGVRAKERIASQLYDITGWHIKQGDYASSRSDMDATWFVDPPYADKGKFYRVKFSAFDELGSWCRSLRGQVTVCEGPNASWLPFEPLGSFKSSLGRADEFVFAFDTPQMS